MARSQGQTILKVNNLNVKSNSGIILHGIDLSIVEGDTVGFVGASGSGKTMTILSAFGFTSEDLKVTFDQVSYREKSHKEIRYPKDVAIVFQNANMALNPIKKCGRQIYRIVRKHLNLSKEQAKDQVLELFKKVELGDPHRIYNSYPHEVSGGELQRVMIAMGLSCSPNLLILDEPTASLDKIIHRKVIDLLKKLKEENGLTLILISHDLELIAELSDRIVHIESGKIISDQLTEDFFINPEHEISAKLITTFKRFREGKYREPKSFSEFLSIKEGEKVFRNGKQAFHNIDLKIYQGEKLGLVGESGSGKSTLSMCIAGIIKLTKGSIHYNIDLKKIAYVFQNAYSALDPELSVKDILHEVIRLQEIPADPEILMEQVILDKKLLTRKISELSGGQRQRVNLARALASKPEMLICDEITSGLDVNVQFEIIELLVKKMVDLTIVFVSHDISLVKNFCERVAIMKDGNIIEVGSTHEIFENSKDNYSNQLINSVPKVKYILNM